MVIENQRRLVIDHHHVSQVSPSLLVDSTAWRDYYIYMLGCIIISGTMLTWSCLICLRLKSQSQQRNQRRYVNAYHRG